VTARRTAGTGGKRPSPERQERAGKRAYRGTGEGAESAKRKLLLAPRPVAFDAKRLESDESVIRIATVQIAVG
jgi:hypothetical protein